MDKDLKERFLKLFEKNKEDEIINDSKLDDENQINNVSDNLPLSADPSYPGIAIHDATIPLQNKFEDSDYTDNNYVGNTWRELIRGFYS